MGSRQIMAVAWLAMFCMAGLARAKDKETVSARPARPLAALEERGLKPKDTFRECDTCSEMVVVPAGSFTMGSPPEEQGRNPNEGPQHVVTISKPFAVAKFEVTVDQFSTFVRKTGYQANTTCYKWKSFTWEGSWHDPGFLQEGSHPVVCVSWNDANAYAKWVTIKTGKPYRLLSEAEWEYAARGRTSPGAYPRFWFGDHEIELCHYGNSADLESREVVAAAIPGGNPIAAVPCDDGYAFTSPVGHYQANAFGLYDMAGNAWQWTADCFQKDFMGVPTDGSALTAEACPLGHVIRGGSWYNISRYLRAAMRSNAPAKPDYSTGFRLGRTLTP